MFHFSRLVKIVQITCQETADGQFCAESINNINTSFEWSRKFEQVYKKIVWFQDGRKSHIKLYKSISVELTVENNCIFSGNCLLVAINFRRKILEEIYSSFWREK